MPPLGSFQMFMGNYPSCCPPPPSHYGWGGADNISQSGLLERIVTVKSGENILDWAGFEAVQGTRLANRISPEFLGGFLLKIIYNFIFASSDQATNLTGRIWQSTRPKSSTLTGSV